jgi:hypothetical protein
MKYNETSSTNGMLDIAIDEMGDEHISTSAHTPPAARCF